MLPTPSFPQPASVEHVDLALRSELLQHCTRTIAETSLQLTPFPHFLVHGFLPQEVYNELICSFPAPEEYEAFGYEKHQAPNGSSNRFRYQFSNRYLAKLPPVKRKLWFTIRSVLGSHDFKQTVFEKLAPGLELRYGAELAGRGDLAGYALPELFRETEGYSIKPHPDTRKKVVTMQFALASDEGQRELGTEFYRRSAAPRNWLRQPYGFEVAKKMPFSPNTVYAFSVLNTVRLKSWHGRTAIPGDFGVRNSILNIWYEQAENGNQELIDESHWFATTAVPALRAA
ncbi:hypothetical protein [Aureliella helgolandensis]|uniref:Prolyl 4-hydroxylase alpha subunit Fe(2+) 2OG dioxygenase domain-containing protein n=1 Tax=Aureliella helgolandensis TaxID=2527968 RepID=A0A518GEQ4_9BACT|nr:hypothetical protein [Aureliella helgolandensis]QDV27079.1 hypothetical protein Q31a_54640 [Aureliella helgolandensis]